MEINKFLQELKIPKEFHEMLTKEFLTDFFNEVINAYKFSDIKEGREPRSYETYSYMGWWIHINLSEIFSDSFCVVCNKHGFSDMADFYSKVDYPYSDSLDEYICDCMMEYGLMQLKNDDEIDVEEYTPPTDIDSKIDYHFVSVLYSKCSKRRIQDDTENTLEQGSAFFDSKNEYINALNETCQEVSYTEVFEFYKNLEIEVQANFDSYMGELLNDYELLKIAEERTRNPYKTISSEEFKKQMGIDEEFLKSLPDIDLED